MRTTLSLDDDVAAALRQLQKRSGDSWKKVVNEVVRAGINAYELEAGRSRRVRRTRSVHLGKPRLGDISNVHEVLSLAEGDERR